MKEEATASSLDPAAHDVATPDFTGALAPVPSSPASTSYHPSVLKLADSFVVLDPFGDAQATSAVAEGLFFEDTRYLSRLVLSIDGLRPSLLSSVLTEENLSLVVDLTNPALNPYNPQSEPAKVPRETVHVLRTKMLSDGSMFETISLHNYGSGTVSFRLGLDFDADFTDMFELRGSTRQHHGVRLADERHPEGVTLGYRGLDGLERRTHLTFAPPPSFSHPRQALWAITLQAGERQELRLTVRCEHGQRPASAMTIEQCRDEAHRRLTRRHERMADVYTSNESFNNWLSRSRADLGMLVTETPYGLYPHAGIPWFSTAFGRDGIITAFECLWMDPDLAAGTLRFLAAYQATELDPRVDAEPGKILHETRKDEMARLGEVPFGRYYGSVDSTPLFIMLAAAYYDRTGDLDLIRGIWPNIEAALGWMRDYGDLDGDGFLEYDRKSVNGLINQGWKDSGDSVFHADGRLAEAPIALAEVQSYAYAAYEGAGRLARLLDEPERAKELSQAAHRLRQNFAKAFWVEELGTYALALDGRKQPCKVISSNAGHVLWGGLADPRHAERVAATLTAPPSFSDWGVRTIANTEKRYNPMSYHNGSVWPHDNGLIALGFARYGLRQPLTRIFTGLFDAALFTDMMRLPELFCGFDRRPGSGPTAYPVACIPQAWAAASAFAVLGASLGLRFDAKAREVRFIRPMLPGWLGELRLTNLRLGNAKLDVMLRRHQEDVAINILNREGELSVITES